MPTKPLKDFFSNPFPTVGKETFLAGEHARNAQKGRRIYNSRTTDTNNSEHNEDLPIYKLCSCRSTRSLISILSLRHLSIVAFRRVSSHIVVASRRVDSIGITKVLYYIGVRISKFWFMIVGAPLKLTIPQIHKYNI